jgi:hypothetical protein
VAQYGVAPNSNVHRLNEDPVMSPTRARVASLVFTAGLLVGAGCTKAPPPAPVAPPVAPPPTAFFEWCKQHQFGVDSPQSKQIAAGVKNLPAGAPIGDVELEAWTKCSTAAEADVYLAGVERDLRRAAQEHGVQPDAAGPAGPGSGFVIRYQLGRVRGTLTGAMELRDNKEAER